MQSLSSSVIDLPLIAYPITYPDSFTSSRSYQFTIRQQSAVSFRLSNLTGDATLTLNDRSNRQLFASANSGRQPESIQAKLEAGTYSLQLTAASADPINYRLDIHASFTGLSNLILSNIQTGELISQQMDGTQLGAVRTRDRMTDPNWSLVDFGNYDSTPDEEWLWRNSHTGETAFWKRNGEEIEAVFLLTVDPSWKLIKTGDFDLDGDRDLIWRNEQTGENAWWQMNGMKLENGFMLDPAEKSWNLEDVYDIDGDGDLDLLWIHSKTGETAWWRMNGATLETGIYLPTVGLDWKFVGKSDFEGDGERDLVWRNICTGEVAIWQMMYRDIMNAIVLPVAPDSDWTIKGFNDLTGDRQPDILWQHSKTGEVGYWEIYSYKLIRGEMISTSTLGTQDWQILTPIDRFVDPVPPTLPKLQSGTIQGFVWNDLDADGIQDANESGLSGQTIFLEWHNQYEQIVTRSTLTDAKGNYRFTGVLEGNYEIKAQPRWELTEIPKISIAAIAGQITDFNIGLREVAGSPPDFKTTTLQFGTAGYEESRSLAIDASGNRYLTGFTSGDFAAKNAGRYDAWIAKFDAQNNLVWKQQFGTSQFDQARDIAIDGTGNLYIAGWSGSSYSSGAAWVAKYDNNGNQLWISQLPNLNASAHDVTLDSAGNLYLSMQGVPLNPKSALEDTVLTKLDPDGKIVWQTSAEKQSHTGAIVDVNGNIYTSGTGFALNKYDNQGQLVWKVAPKAISHDVTLGLSGDVYVTGRDYSSGGYDAWVASYDSTGKQNWIRQLGNPRWIDDFAEVVISDRLGNIYIGGTTYGVLGKQSFGRADVFVAKYDANGRLLWLEQFGTDRTDSITGLQVDDAGRIYLSGFTDGTLGDKSAGFTDAWLRVLEPMN